METIDFYQKNSNKMVLCLGLFDGFHKGHLEIISRAAGLCGFFCAKLGLFTFDDGDFTTINKSKGLVFSLSERLMEAEKQKVDFAVIAPFNKKFLSLSDDEFLDTLENNFNLAAVVCGEDYTFGHGGLGKAQKLKNYFESKNVQVEIVPTINNGSGQKISTTLIKRELSLGNIKSANSMLDKPYYISGLVESGRHIGRELGFPTINVRLSANRVIKAGVYKTQTLIKGALYNSITNYGGAPTFDRDATVLETHILGREISAEIGESVTVYFIDFIRDIKPFKNRNELIEQLNKDKKAYD